MTDADDNVYIDYINSWGPAILGHTHPEVLEAIKKQAEKGFSYGTPSELETEIAKLIVENVPNIDQIRMVSSGTEACMSAIRLARGFTGRDKIIKFEGCYHGHSDSFLIKAGSGAATFGNPNSPGVTAGTAKDTLLAKYNDTEQVADLFRHNPGEIAAVIVEPVAGNMGCVLTENNFLQNLRKLCDENGALLIFDEVMTGFRVGLGGAQAHFGIDPDLTCFGKIIGAGLPVGAFGGKKEVMSCIAPLGGVYQAGTLSGNPLAMRAGIAMFEDLTVDGFYAELAAKVDRLVDGFQAVADKHGINMRTNKLGGMFGMFFVKDNETDTPKNFDDVTECDMTVFNTFFHGMLDRGIYLAPSAYEAGFMSIKHSNEDIDASIKAADEIFAEMAKA